MADTVLSNATVKSERLLITQRKWLSLMKYSYWRSIFVPLAGSEYQLFGTRAIVLHHRLYSLLSQHLDKFRSSKKMHCDKCWLRWPLANQDKNHPCRSTIFILFCFLCFRLRSWLLIVKNNAAWWKLRRWNWGSSHRPCSRWVTCVPPNHSYVFYSRSLQWCFTRCQTH